MYAVCSSLQGLTQLSSLGCGVPCSLIAVSFEGSSSQKCDFQRETLRHSTKRPVWLVNYPSTIGRHVSAAPSSPTAQQRPVDTTQANTRKPQPQPIQTPISSQQENTTEYRHLRTKSSFSPFRKGPISDPRALSKTGC